MISPLRHTELLPGTLQNLYFPPPDYKYFRRAKEQPFAMQASSYAPHGPRMQRCWPMREWARSA